MKTPKPLKRRAFTLVEILCVLAIIAVLSAIIFPVLAHMRENGRRTVCISNLHQIALAMQQYVQDSDGRYPSSFDFVSTWNRKLLPYLKTEDVFICPTQVPNSPQQQPNMPHTPYEYNFHRLDDFTRRRVIEPTKGRSETELRNLATIWMNTDTQMYHTPDELIICGRHFQWETMHSGGANYSFLDGHVKWLLPTQMSEIECSNGPLPPPFDERMGM